MSNPTLAKAQSEEVLSRFAPAGSWQVVLLRGTGAEPSIDEDGDTVKAAIQRLRAFS